MQQAITLDYQGKILRGMEHVPEQEAGQRLPAVILYHGFTGTKLEPHRMFLKICRRLEALGIACFRYDFLGSGESDGNFEEMTVSGEIAEAGAILDAVKADPRIDPERVILLGMSMGGLVASVLAGERPHDVHKLVLLAPAGEMYALVREVVDGVLAIPDLQLYDYNGNLIGRSFAEDVKTLNVLQRAKGFSGDVMMIHGTKDPTVPYQVSLDYQEVAYGGRALLHLIEGADHTFNKTSWEQDVIGKICDFLR
ncbi:alpha/beta hydrolase [Tumebacillus algifaecis]|uniref:Alpha/beta hydrolase n=1 Tax=Tumebacillus algifaecis TaxID=1214604 RepID=A0A223D3K3_9BACL|nr:alpha/beta fold hydrolase [Tumebacillus algifaecis]ASS75993.1 alpha/beta hydrolase [Tumebacillus algifaecis]